MNFIAKLTSLSAAALVFAAPTAANARTCTSKVKCAVSKLYSATSSLKSEYVESLKDEGRWPARCHERNFYYSIISFQKAVASLSYLINQGASPCRVERALGTVQHRYETMLEYADEVHLCSCVRKHLRSTECAMGTAEEAIEERLEELEEYADHTHDHGHYYGHNRGSISFGNGRFGITIPLR